MEIKKVGILIFNDVELLDFAGPLQVFSAANYVDDDLLSVPMTIGTKSKVRVSKSKISITCNKRISGRIKLDLFIIPGGFGTRSILEDKKLLTKIDKIIANSKVTASVCTGSLILAKLGYLKDKTATTHFAAVDLLQNLDETITVDRSKRYIDHGDIVVAEGVSAGIDMSFYLLEKYYGKSLSDEVRKYIEYYPEQHPGLKG